MVDKVLNTRENRKYTEFPTDLSFPKRVFLESLICNDEGLRILVRSSDKNATDILSIYFEECTVAFRCMDEGVYPASWSKNIPSFISIVENSEYIEWFNQESGGIRRYKGLVHYAIYTENECIDVIDLEPPKLKWL